METSGAKAMYEGQGVENYVFKSGTNQFHGGVFEYFRNTDFDARGFFAPTTPIEHQNEFGARSAGPSRRTSYFSSVITMAIASIPRRLRDTRAYRPRLNGPAISALSAADLRSCERHRHRVRTPFPNNTIPSNRISKVAQSFQSYLPPPTNGAITNNYLATLPNLVNNDSTTDKVDYNLTDKPSRVCAVQLRKVRQPDRRQSYANQHVDAARAVYRWQRRNRIRDSRPDSRHHTLSVRTLVNQFSVSVSRLFIPLTSNTASGDYPSKAGLTGLPPGIASTGFPDITFSGNNAPVSWDGTNSHAFNEAQNTYDAAGQSALDKREAQPHLRLPVSGARGQRKHSLTGTQAGFTFSNNETANFNSTGTLDQHYRVWGMPVICWARWIAAWSRRTRSPKPADVTRHTPSMCRTISKSVRA